MKYFLSILVLLILCSSCRKPTLNFSCNNSKLKVEKGQNSCVENPDCGEIKVKEVNYLDEESFNWIPQACNIEVGDQLTFTNGTTTTKLNITDKGHYIAHDKKHSDCEHHHSSVCLNQKNEIIYYSFLNDQLGSDDTVHYEVRTRIWSYDAEIEEPGPKVDFVQIYQPRTNTNVANFIATHRIGEDSFDTSRRTYHDSITLSNTLFEDVVETKFASPSGAIPHLRLYIKENLGLFAFEKDSELWIME